MRKEMLRKLRTLNATPAIERRAKNDITVVEKVKTWRGEEERVKILHKYAYYMRCQHLSGILKVAMFAPHMIQSGDAEPIFEIYLNIAGREYITRYFKGGSEKWSKGKIDSLAGLLLQKLGIHAQGWYWSYESRCTHNSWINPEGAKSIRALLKTKATGYEGILEWQETVKKEKRDKADAKVFEEWDADLKLFPRIPKRFVDWAFKDNTEHYIFYNAGKKIGYCSRCRRYVAIQNPRHKKEGICTGCGSKIIYQANGKRSKYLQTPIGASQIIQPIPGGYAIQIIETQRRYNDYGAPRPIDKPYMCWSPLYKILVRGESVVCYKEGWYKNRIRRWIPDTWGGWEYPGKVYKGNIRDIKKAFPQSAVPILIKNGIEIPFIRYIEREAKYPVYESLVKIGLYEIVVDNLKSYVPERFITCREASKALEIDNSRLKRLVDLGGTVGALEWLRLEKRRDTIFDHDMIRYFDKNGIWEYRLNFIADRMSYKKIWHYLMKQEMVSKETPDQLITTWRDYLNMAERNKLDTRLEQNYKPANLKEAHALQIRLAKKEEVKKQAASIRRKYKKLEKNIADLSRYEYSADGYAVVAPKCVEDIILEGTILGHCIHRCDFYFERINTKESFILFLRRQKTPDSPWYTLEVEPGGNIRQKRTTGDNQNTDLQAAVPFLKKWQHEVRNRMNKEDKKLAKLSDAKRIENYKNIRTDKKLVWHGKHSGELLADVLEADFMAAI